MDDASQRRHANATRTHGHMTVESDAHRVERLYQEPPALLPAPIQGRVSEVALGRAVACNGPQM